RKSRKHVCPAKPDLRLRGSGRTPNIKQDQPLKSDGDEQPQCPHHMQKFDRRIKGHFSLIDGCWTANTNCIFVYCASSFLTPSVGGMHTYASHDGCVEYIPAPSIALGAMYNLRPEGRVSCDTGRTRQNR